MEKTNESHDVKYDKGKKRIILTSTTVRELNITEAILEVGNIRERFQKVESAIVETNMNIKEKALEKQLEMLDGEKKMIQEVMKNYGNAIKEPSEDLESEMRVKLKDERKKSGYNAIRGDDKRLVKKSHIITQVLTDFGLPTASPYRQKMHEWFHKL